MAVVESASDSKDEALVKELVGQAGTKGLAQVLHMQPAAAPRAHLPLLLLLLPAPLLLQRTLRILHLLALLRMVLSLSSFEGHCLLEQSLCVELRLLKVVLYSLYIYVSQDNASYYVVLQTLRALFYFFQFGFSL